MKVWWCQEHDSQKYPIHSVPARCFQVLVFGNFKIDAPCRMVPMRLIPAGRTAEGPRCPCCHGSGMNEGAAVLDGETP